MAVQRSAQLVGHVADEAGLAFLLHGQVAHLGLGLLAQRDEIVGQHIRFVELAVGFDSDARIAFEHGFRLAVQA